MPETHAIITHEFLWVPMRLGVINDNYTTTFKQLKWLTFVYIERRVIYDDVDIFKSLYFTDKENYLKHYNIFSNKAEYTFGVPYVEYSLIDI